MTGKNVNKISSGENFLSLIGHREIKDNDFHYVPYPITNYITIFLKEHCTLPYEAVAHLEYAGKALKFVRDIGNLREIPMMDFAERICTFGDFYKKFEAFF